MVGIDPEGRTPLKTFDQFEIAIKNLDSVLREAGGKPEHIVKVTVFLTNISDRSVINPIRQRYFGASTHGLNVPKYSKSHEKRFQDATPVLACAEPGLDSGACLR